MGAVGVFGFNSGCLFLGSRGCKGILIGDRMGRYFCKDIFVGVCVEVFKNVVFFRVFGYFYKYFVVVLVEFSVFFLRLFLGNVGRILYVFLAVFV